MLVFNALTKSEKKFGGGGGEHFLPVLFVGFQINVVILHSQFMLIENY